MIFNSGPPCASNPCQNGATCTDAEDRYICSCDRGFEGLNCERGEHKRKFSWDKNYWEKAKTITKNTVQHVMEFIFESYYSNIQMFMWCFRTCMACFYWLNFLQVNIRAMEDLQIMEEDLQIMTENGMGSLEHLSLLIKTLILFFFNHYE